MEAQEAHIECDAGLIALNEYSNATLFYSATNIAMKVNEVSVPESDIKILAVKDLNAEELKTLRPTNNMVEQKNIKVVVRVRPYNRREMEQNQRCIVKTMDKTSLLFDPDEEDDEFFFQGMKQNYRDITKRMHKKMTMEYDRVYGIETTNEQIFEECTAPLVDSVLNGYNCSVFVYGATGAGKTYTMLGNENTRGITFLTMKDLFAKINTQSDMRKFDVGVSYVEVYNEQVMNLLTKSGPMKLREDSSGVIIHGLVLKPIHSADELLQLLAQGNSNRTQHPTDANAESSRSHAIFQVHIRMTEKKTGTKRMVKLSMIDLAGSERAASTKGVGVRFKEGASINKSLLALGNCINKLADGLKHIPYRDSNLTRILKDSLGGNCQTLMVANVSMSSLTYEDTYNTLKYASRAKKIRTTLRQNALTSNMPKEFYIKKVQELMETNKNLESKVSQLQKDLGLRGSNGYDKNELKIWYDKIDAVYSIIVRTQEYVYGMVSKKKIFQFRTKIKEDAEACRKILSIDHNKHTIDDFGSSVIRFGKQLENQQEDLERWRKKLHDAQKELEKLRKEINASKCSEVLQPYLKGKDLEIQYSRQKIRFDHISRIVDHCVAESYKMRKSLITACETLKSTFESLPSDNELKGKLESTIENVSSIVCSYDANLLGEVKKDLNDDMDIQMDQDIETLINLKREHTNYNEDDDGKENDIKKRLRIKRLCYGTDSDLAANIRADTDSDSDFLEGFNSTFKKPKTINLAGTMNKVANPNETQVLYTDSDSFELCTPSTSARALLNVVNKNNLVSNMLSENIVRMQSSKNLQPLKDVLLKSNKPHRGILKTLTGSRKENKKFSPNRVRKSPRPGVLRAANMGKKFPTSTISDSSEPVVRLNRAASIRFKK